MSAALITNVEFRGTGLRIAYLPELLDSFGIDNIGWKVLVDTIFPNTQTATSIIMALAYCHKRSLDIFKRPVHIVPMWSTAANRMIDTVWPSIAELRTTAFRTGLYAGREETCFGRDLEETIGKMNLTFPEWAQITVYRLVGTIPRAFPGPRVYWRESYAWLSKEDKSPNAMWRKRPHGQLEKCAEAASLRGAFPEDIGSDYAAEEMDGQRLFNDARNDALNESIGSASLRRTAPPPSSSELAVNPLEPDVALKTAPEQNNIDPAPVLRRAPPPFATGQMQNLAETIDAVDVSEVSRPQGYDYELIRGRFCDALKAAQSSEDLGEAWNKIVEPHFDALSRPDQEDLFQLNRLRAGELPDE